MNSNNWIDVFRDKKLNKVLQRDGIVKFTIPDFDATKFTEILTHEVDGYPEKFSSEFYGSVEMSDIEQKRRIDLEIQRELTPTLNTLLSNHQVLTYFFLVKGLGADSILNLHQDWSIVDELKYCAYNFWVPLSDSTKQNGALHVAKGTHRFPLNIRGGGIPPKFNEHFSLLEEYMEVIEVKVGEALIFDASLLHYSPPNTSDQPRTALVSNIIPSEAQTYCYHGTKIDNSLHVRQYEVPNDLFIHYNDFNNEKDAPNPKGKLIKEIDYANVDRVTASEFVRMLKETSTRKKSWLSLFR